MMNTLEFYRYCVFWFQVINIIDKCSFYGFNVREAILYQIGCFFTHCLNVLELSMIKFCGFILFNVLELSMVKFCGFIVFIPCLETEASPWGVVLDGPCLP